MDVTRTERIAIICSVGGWGGQEQNTVKTVSWLREAGVDITLITASDSRLTTAARELGLPLITFDHTGKHLVWSDARRLRAVLDEHGFTTLIIGHTRHLYISVWAARYAARYAPVGASSKLRLIYWQHVQITMSRKDPYHAWFYRQLDTFIAPLDYLEEQALERTSLQCDQIVRIPHVIDTAPLLRSVITRSDARAMMNLPQDTFLVGTIGRIDRAKGQEYLLHAVADLRRDGRSIEAVLIGENSREDYLGELTALAQQLGISDAVHVRDHTSQIEAAFRSLDVFAMTSISEPIGMVTLEAMAMGVPVIGTNSGGTPELLDHGRVGRLIAPGDAAQLGEAIAWCMDHEEEVGLMVDDAQTWVRERFDRSHQVELFTHLLYSS